MRGTDPQVQCRCMASSVHRPRSRAVRRLVAAILLAVVTASLGTAPSPVQADASETATGQPAFRFLTTGSSHSCAILDNGLARCWGRNSQGQLGLGDVDARGDGPGEMGDNLPTVDLGTGRTATAITAGGNFTCALLDNGSLKCWGGNSIGQLGLGDVDARGDGPGEMGDNLPTIDLGTDRTATAISTGSNHTCAILTNNDVVCWGQNTYSQLGLGSSVTIGDTETPADAGPVSIF